MTHFSNCENTLSPVIFSFLCALVTMSKQHKVGHRGHLGPCAPVSLLSHLKTTPYYCAKNMCCYYNSSVKYLVRGLMTDSGVQPLTMRAPLEFDMRSLSPRHQERPGWLKDHISMCLMPRLLIMYDDAITSKSNVHDNACIARIMTPYNYCLMLNVMEYVIPAQDFYFWNTNLIH